MIELVFDAGAHGVASGGEEFLQGGVVVEMFGDAAGGDETGEAGVAAIDVGHGWTRRGVKKGISTFFNVLIPFFAGDGCPEVEDVGFAGVVAFGIFEDAHHFFGGGVVGGADLSFGWGIGFLLE